jgi:hypothetical protein
VVLREQPEAHALDASAHQEAPGDDHPDSIAGWRQPAAD